MKIKKINLKFILFIFILLIINLCCIYINGNELTMSEREKNLCKLYQEKKLLLLTFDDGPSSYTPKLLEILKKNNVKATFFVLGSQAEKYPEIVKKTSEYGNLVYIHSYTHTFFTKIDKSAILSQINKTKDIISPLVQNEIKYIRVPYGIINDNVKEILKEENLENVLWTGDSLDWKYKEKDITVANIKKDVTGNDIILMHDILKSSVEATDELISYYKELGFEFVTIDEFNHIKIISNNLKI